MKEEKISINNIDYNDFSEENAKKIVDSFKMKDVSSLKSFLDYIENYYRTNKNVIVFKNLDVFSHIIDTINLDSKLVQSNSSDSEKLKKYKDEVEIFKLFVSKKYFTELVNPLNDKIIDICKFQTIIDKIYQHTGVYVQDKYSKLYKSICDIIEEKIRKICLRNKSLIDSIPEEYKEMFISENVDFYLGRNRYIYENEPFIEIMNNSKLIKLYIDLLVARLFETSPNVVYFDIMSLLKVNGDLHILSDEDRELYNYILSSVSCNDIDKAKEMISRMKTIHITEKFYDDMLKTRRASEQAIAKDLYKPNDDDLYRDERYPDAIVYDLRDENKKINMVIRDLSRPYSENIKNRRFLCCSLIKENNTASHFGSNYTYGYDVGEDDIIWQAEGDAGSVKDSELLANNRSILIPGGGFILDEINLNNETIVENGETKYIQRKPSYIVAYDEITDRVYNESKRLNIPIYLVRTVVDIKDEDYYLGHESESQFYHNSNNMLSPEEFSRLRH